MSSKFCSNTVHRSPAVLSVPPPFTRPHGITFLDHVDPSFCFALSVPKLETDSRWPRCRDHAGGVLCPCACCSRLASLRGLLRAPVSPAVEPKIVDAARSACGWSCFVFRGLRCLLFTGRATSQAAWCAQPPGCTYRACRALWAGVFSMGRTTARAPPRRCPTRLLRPSSARKIRAVGWV